MPMQFACHQTIIKLVTIINYQFLLLSMLISLQYYERKILNHTKMDNYCKQYHVSKILG